MNLSRNLKNLLGLVSIFALSANLMACKGDDDGEPGGFSNDDGYSGNGDDSDDDCDAPLPDHVSFWGADGAEVTIDVNGYDPQFGTAPYDADSQGYGFDYDFDPATCGPFYAHVTTRGTFVFDSPDVPMEVFEKSGGSFLKRNVTTQFIGEKPANEKTDWKIVYDGSSIGN
jgi:hypothetical protein